MSNRIEIVSISIENFRSIKRLTIGAGDMTVFVGLNDAGKSNIIKALNLFFNDQTDYDTSFDFQRDFSSFFDKNSKKAREIRITVEFMIPKTFNNPGKYKWEKSWRENSHNEKMTDSTGNPVKPKSKIPDALRKIKFRYVPAVKTKEFFKGLLAELYITASTVLDSPLQDSMETFSHILQEYTMQIEKEVDDRIGIVSKLTMPPDLSEMFKTLIFETTGKKDDFNVPLELRGDGIQARHIPIILKYIADKDSEIRGRGMISPITIWGYEEPENGIELSKAFDMARDFNEYSSDMQIFVTTHSPAFYLSENARVLYVSKKDGEPTKASETENQDYVIQTMGLMPIVAPFIAEKENELIMLKREYIDNIDNSLTDVPTIFVEGKIDKEYLKMAINLFSPKLDTALKANRLKIYTREGEGGCSRVTEYAKAWILSGNKNKAVALYDKDKAGRFEYGKLTSDELFKKKNHGKVIAQYYKPDANIKQLYDIGCTDFPYEIEHLLSIDFWKKIRDKGYTVKRDKAEIFEFSKNLIPIDRSLNELFSEKISEDLIDTIVYYGPDDDNKKRIMELVKNADESVQRDILYGLKDTVLLLEQKLAPSSGDSL